MRSKEIKIKENKLRKKTENLIKCHLIEHYFYLGN